MYWTDGSGRITLQITKAQALIGCHPGECDNDISALRKTPSIRRQLARLDPDHVSHALREYGAWSEEELNDHESNIARLLWIACGDITDGNI